MNENRQAPVPVSMTFDEWWDGERSKLYQDRNSHEAARAAWDAALSARTEIGENVDKNN